MSDIDPSNPQPGPVVQATKIHCPQCGYNLTGIAIGSSCPECGLVVGSGIFGANHKPTSGKAIASMVLGIVSIVGCCMWGLPGVICGGLAVILGRGVRDQVNAGEVHPSSQSMAAAGVTCGAIGLVLGLLFVGLLVVGIIGDM
ncbi:MAG: hypothetical protein AAGA25_10915 [Planctomycetota bacterium]